MKKEEFLKYLHQGKYDKLSKLINNYPNILSFLEELFISDNKDNIRRALLVLKRLDNRIIERYLFYVILALNEKRMISKEAEEILKKISNKENIDDAIIEIAKKTLDERIIYLFIENMDYNNVFFKAILENTMANSIEDAIKILLKEYNANEILIILANKLYSQKKSERELAVEILLNIVDSLDEKEKEILKNVLDISLLGDENKKLYRRFKKLFEKLNIYIKYSNECIKSLLKTNGKRALNIIVRENIKIPQNFYDREFLKEFLYCGDEEQQFVGVKLVSLMKDSKNKVNLLFKFLNYGYGKAKTAAIRELKKIAKNEDLRNYIENKILMYAKKMNLSLKISALRILKELADRKHLTFLINEHKRLKNLMYKLDEEKYLGGFRHMIMMEEEIGRCKLAMGLIEEIIAKICLKYDIHYNSLRISEKLGYEFYKTICEIGAKNLNLINIYEFLEDIKKNGKLIIYLPKIIENNEIDDKLAKEILNIIENIDIEDKDLLNANKIIIYASLNRVDKIGDIVNMAIGYYSKQSFIKAIKKFIDKNLLDNDTLNLIIPKIAEMLYDTKSLRLFALEFFKQYPNELVLPILLNELRYNKKEEKLIIDVISNIILNYPHNISTIKNLLNTDKRKVALKIMLNISEKIPNLLEDYIYLLAGMYNSANEEEKRLIKKILNKIATKEQKFILKPILNS